MTYGTAERRTRKSQGVVSRNPTRRLLQLCMNTAFGRTDCAVMVEGACRGRCEHCDPRLGPYAEYGGIEHAPDWLLKYIAPMACGERERAELCRRYVQQKDANCNTRKERVA